MRGREKEINLNSFFTCPIILDRSASTVGYPYLWVSHPQIWKAEYKRLNYSWILVSTRDAGKNTLKEVYTMLRKSGKNENPFLFLELMKKALYFIMNCDVSCGFFCTYSLSNFGNCLLFLFC